MTTIERKPAATASERPQTAVRRLPAEVWASLAISAMWLAVVFASLFGPDFVSANAGTSYTRIPSGVIVALFALIGTIAVARRGFGPRRDD